MIINYTITSGILPITVTVGGLTNEHNAYESGTFTLAEGNYTLTITDDEGCVATESITLCTTCPAGYTALVDKCIRYLETTVAYYSTSFTIVKKSANPAYSVYGALLFNTFASTGVGTFDRITSAYWTNQPYPSLIGPMNRSAVWASTTYNNQQIGFSFCVNIAKAKTYYVGVGCDNWAKIKLNGEFVIEQDRDLLMAMVDSEGLPGGTDYGTPHKYWYIYPVEFPAGQNVIEVYGENELSVAGVGIEIYDNTRLDLQNATSDADLSILFRSADLAGQPIMYEYSTANGYHGYYCPDGYALDTCGEVPRCVKKILLDCGDNAPPESTNNFVSNERTNCDTSLTLTPADFTFTDPESDTLTAVKIISYTGTLTLGGVTVTANQELAVTAGAFSAALVYAPVSATTTEYSDDIQFEVKTANNTDWG